MIGSLFSGVGGLELGLEWAGLGPVVWQCEQDPYCRAVLAKHWPDAVRYDDVRTLPTAAVPAVDVMCGGFPCQDLSAANPAGEGLDGPRSGLWFEYLRIVREVRPRAVVVENVGRLARRGLDVVAGGLADAGYQVEVTRIFAADVGAPHLRERIFVVGVADTHREGQPQPSGALGAQRGRAVDGGELGHADRAGLEVLPGIDGPDEQPSPLGAGGCGDERGGTPQPRVGRIPHGLPHWVDGAGPGGAWPAPRGAAQRPWEAPRTERGVVNRQARLRALGNAVVPQVAYVVGLRLRERMGGA